MKEIRYFQNQPLNTRILIGTSFLYAFVLPIVEIFTAAYIMRNSADVSRVVLYQLTVYTGIPLTFLLNGYLLNKIRPAWLYTFGMFLSGVSMLIMTSLSELNMTGIGIAGLVMGMSFGLYWANRDYLVLVCTTDKNRNYYYGLDTFVNTVSFVVVPLCVGWFIALSTTKGWTASANASYQVVVWICIAITLASSYVVLQGKFDKPKQERFLYFRFHPLWNKMLGMAVLKGLVQGFIVTAPAMLVMKLIGNEGALGTVQSISAVVTAVVMYIIGRTTAPRHRLAILGVSLLLFALGAVVNSALFNTYSVIFFLLCLIVARPLFDISYFPIQLRVIDHLSAIEKRNEFAYILHHEFGLYGGRLVGCGLFIILAWKVSDVAALKYTLPIVTILQAFSYFLAKQIQRSLPETAETPQPEEPLSLVKEAPVGVL
jgi:YQGE family putative transporter